MRIACRRRPRCSNHGHYIASICEIVRWLGEKAEAAGVNLFTGFPVASLLVEGERVIGVRTTPSGLERDGTPGSSYTPPTDLTARVTVLSEGTRGSLTQAYCGWRGIGSPNPQIFALGVKEIWETTKPLDSIIHTLGWPLPNDAFGGSFMYPLGEKLIAIGIVVGLDYHAAALDVHELLQRLKLHPLVRPYLEGGEMVEWGAKTIPEGGYYAIPDRCFGDGVLIVGDAAGFVEVASLKGIHYAMQSGIFAARAIFDALKKQDTSAAALAPYDRMVKDSYIARDLYERRNMRLAFQHGGLYAGGIKAGLMTLTKARSPAAASPRKRTPRSRARRSRCRICSRTASSPSASSTRCSSRGTRRATTSRRTSSSARTFRRRSRTSTRTCAPPACTSATAIGWW